VPTIAWWPGRIAAASVCDTMAGTVDLLPTFVQLAGGKLSAKPMIDGRTLWPRGVRPPAYRQCSRAATALSGRGAGRSCW
jgi:arylsulfatase A-like enzyme